MDPTDWLLYAGYRWRAKRGWGGWYAAARIKVNGRPRWFYLHRLIAKCPAGMVTHHIDGDTMNNRRANHKNMSPAEHEDLHKLYKIGTRKWAR